MSAGGKFRLQCCDKSEGVASTAWAWGREGLQRSAGSWVRKLSFPGNSTCRGVELGSLRGQCRAEWSLLAQAAETWILILLEKGIWEVLMIIEFLLVQACGVSMGVGSQVRNLLEASSTWDFPVVWLDRHRNQICQHCECACPLGRCAPATLPRPKQQPDAYSGFLLTQGGALCG